MSFKNHHTSSAYDCPTSKKRVVSFLAQELRNNTQMKSDLRILYLTLLGRSASFEKEHSLLPTWDNKKHMERTPSPDAQREFGFALL